MNSLGPHGHRHHQVVVNKSTNNNMKGGQGGGQGQGLAPFAIGLLVGSIASHLLVTFYQRRTGQDHNEKSDEDTRTSPTIMDATPLDNRGGRLPDEIREEMLSRNSLYFESTKGMEDITNSSVMIVGLGGVGSHTAHMLARAGVRYMRLVDFDQVTLSSLNRHAVAKLKDVGLSKATVLCDHLRDICPDPNRLILDPGR